MILAHLAHRCGTSDVAHAAWPCSASSSPRRCSSWDVPYCPVRVTGGRASCRAPVLRLGPQATHADRQRRFPSTCPGSDLRSYDRSYEPDRTACRPGASRRVATKWYQSASRALTATMARLLWSTVPRWDLTAAAHRMNEDRHGRPTGPWGGIGTRGRCLRGDAPVRHGPNTSPESLRFAAEVWAPCPSRPSWTAGGGNAAPARRRATWDRRLLALVCAL